jgi:hypothetical protein
MPKAQPLLAEIISVCTVKDIDVWTVASKHIVQFIQAERYTVIVPDDELALFSSVTFAPYQVKPESHFIGNAKDRIIKKLDKNNQHRVGWYLQQFVKIAAVLQNDASSTVLIWDADTVPLKPLEFTDAQGRLIYYQDEEYRRSYFDFIELALGLKRTQAFSFIAQSFTTKVSWVRELFDTLENSTQMPWIDGILFHLNPAEPAGFSEFETLGTWVWHHHRDEIVITDRPWYRNGLSLVGNPMDLSQATWKGLAKSYDFISFEVWDKKAGLRNAVKIILRKIRFACIGYLSEKP